LLYPTTSQSEVLERDFAFLESQGRRGFLVT
jgi:hypothetical protein